MPAIDEIISSRLVAYNMDRPTLAAKRSLARALIDPTAPNIPVYSEGQEVRYQLSLLWALGRTPVFRVAKHLWTAPVKAKTYAGQRAIVFEHGKEDTAGQLKNGEYMTMRIGTLPSEAELKHYFNGKLHPEAEPSVEGIRAPYVHGVTKLPLLECMRVSLDFGDLRMGKPDAKSEIPIYEATTHVGEDTAYSANSASVRMYPLVVGNFSVEAYLRTLAREVDSSIGPDIYSLALAPVA